MMRAAIWRAAFPAAWLVLFLPACAAKTAWAAAPPPENTAVREHLGDGLFALDAAWAAGTLHLATVENMRFGHGQGENFTHWRRRDGEPNWRRQALVPEHHPGMASILPLQEDATLLLYVDRKDESRRRVHLVRVDAGVARSLWQFEGGQGVLNPHMDRMPDGRLHLLIPDRTDVKVRRFLVDAETGESQRLPDVTMPRSGARIYDRLMDGNQLIVPVCVIHELLLLVIDLNDHRVTMHSVDRFTSVAGEPPRMTAIFRLGKRPAYALVYLRPAAFSDRTGRGGSPTGLLGEIVCNVVEAATWQSTRQTVLAGFRAEAAATHNLAVLPVGAADFLLAHSEVDRIHQRHLTGAYENYVGGFVTRWRIGEDGVPALQGRLPLPPFFSTRLVAAGKGEALLICNEARPGDPLYLYRLDEHSLTAQP